MGDAGIVRNRAKIEATIANARATVGARRRRAGRAGVVLRSAPRARRLRTLDEARGDDAESVALAKALRARGFRFVGPTTAYAAMQACGLVDDHLEAASWSPGRSARLAGAASDAVAAGPVRQSSVVSPATASPPASGDSARHPEGPRVLMGVNVWR
jgi:hypothetical protein